MGGMTASLEPFDVVIFGGGGHARVVLDALFAAENEWQIAVLDPDLAPGPLRGFESVEVLGGDEIAAALAAANPAIRFTIGLGAVGPSGARKRLFDFGVGLGMVPLPIVHPKATVSPMAGIGAGTQVMAGAVVNCGANLGKNVIINTGAVVEHDCLIEDHANIASGACLCGNVVIRAGAFVGAGSVIIQDVTIGARAVVGAGSAVISSIGPEARVGGTPAKALSTQRNPQ